MYKKKVFDIVHINISFQNSVCVSVCHIWSSLTEINIEHCSVCAADGVVSSFQNSVCVSVCLSITFSPPHPRALPEALYTGGRGNI